MKTIKATKVVKTVKNARKKTKPAFIVDLTNVNDANDVYAQFGLAKHNANLPMNDTEFTAILNKTAEVTLDLLYCKMMLSVTPIEINGADKLVFDSKGKFKVKKANIFKRFWNWVCRK